MPILWFALPWGEWIGGHAGAAAQGALLLPGLVYLLLVLLTSFAFNPLTWILTAVGVVASHVTYGIQFVRGLCAKKAPCEFIGKDHGGGKR